MAIERHWQDIRIDTSPNNLWRVHLMNSASHGSAFFPLAYTHFLLTTDWERHIYSGKRAIAVEIVWHTQTGNNRALMRPWMRETTTTVGFLQDIGMLHGCTTSHRCHVYINGQTCVTRWVQFTHGSYVMVEAFPQQLQEDTESEGEQPAPIAGVAQIEDSSSTSSSSSTPSIDPLHLDDAFLTDVIVVHRPPGRIPRPLYMISPVESTDPNNLLVVMQHWNDLRYHTWTLCGVHLTYERDYPPSDDTHVFVLVAMVDLPGPLHQVLLTVAQTPTNMLQKAQVTPPTIDRTTMLILNRLDHFCQRSRTHCRVYLKGQILPDGTIRVVQNGDYVRIVLAVETDTETDAILADEFHTIPDAHGLEYLEESLTNTLSAQNADQENVIQTIPRPTSAPTHQMQMTYTRLQDREHIAYWITTTVFGHCMAGYLLYCARTTKIQGKDKRRLRRRQKPTNRITKVCFILYLLTFTPTTEALQLQSRLTGAPDWQCEHDRKQLMAKLHERHLQVDAFRYLAPPGNPCDGTIQTSTNKHDDTGTDIQWTNLKQQLTPFGYMLLDYVNLTLQMRQWTFHGCDTGVNLDAVQSTQTHEKMTSCQLPCIEEEVVQKPQVLLPVAEDSTAEDNSCGRGAPRETKHDQTIHFRPDVMDDDDDLHSPWSLPPPPDPLLLPLTFHPATETVLQQTDLSEGQVLHVYTDGSASTKQQERDENTWAIAIFTTEDGEATWPHCMLLDWYCGFCDRDPLSAQWLGATDVSSRTAEAEALIWSLLWFLQSRRPGPLHIHSDALSVLNAANGQWGFDTNDTIMLRLRATYQMVETMLGHCNLTLTHVKGYTGDPGNELVDCLANGVRDGTIPPRFPTLNLAKWFHGTVPAITWAWCEFDGDYRPDTTMHYQDGAFRWYPPNPPSPDLEWLPYLSKVTSTSDGSHIQLELCIGSYNVGSIKEAGRAAYLRDQAQHRGYHILGLQETRSTIDDPGDSNYIRLVAAADRGIGGVELWLNRTIPIATTLNDKIYWDREQLQVLHATSQILLVAVTLPFIELLCCVAHAPHSGSPTSQLQQWWANLQTLLQRHLKRRHLLMMIDANADPIPNTTQIGGLQPIERLKPRLGDKLWSDIINKFSLLLPPWMLAWGWQHDLA